MEKLLNASETAAILGVHIKTLYKMLRQNKVEMTFIRVGSGVIRFRPSEVERYLSACEVIRTGSGKTNNAARRKTEMIAELLTGDEEIRAFFAGVEKDEDGNLMCSLGDSE
jgi:excisionase family DNA binding protein